MTDSTHHAPPRTVKCPICPRYFDLPASLANHIGHHHHRDEWEPVLPARIGKDSAECCLAKRDDLMRPVIGFCSPECVRRPVKREESRDLAA